MSRAKNGGVFVVGGETSKMTARGADILLMVPRAEIENLAAAAESALDQRHGGIWACIRDFWSGERWFDSGRDDG